MNRRDATGMPQRRQRRGRSMARRGSPDKTGEPPASDSREKERGATAPLSFVDQCSIGLSPEASPRWDDRSGRNFLKRVLSIAFM